MERDHMQVLKTLYDNGNISRHQMKSIRGQIFKMGWAEREAYLKKIIKRSITVSSIGVR
jgi:hypothetical protein